MTAPIDIFLSVIFSAALVLASRGGLRQNPQPWYATRYFAALGAFLVMLFLPAAGYRYFIYPDWSFMYAFHASSLTGGAGFLALIAIAAAAVGTFWFGDYCSRTGRIWLLLVLLAGAVAGVATVGALGAARLGTVGTYAQWTGTFGLRPLGETDLLLAVLIMGSCVLIGWIYILFILIREGLALGRASR